MSPLEEPRFDFRAEHRDTFSLAARNSPFSNGSSSLFLGEKGEAVSPAMCVSVMHPTFRFFAQL